MLPATPPDGPSPPPGAPPPAGPPRFLLDDVWPWLALFGVVVVAGLLVWLFVFHDRGQKGRVVPAVVGLPQQQAVAKLTREGIDVKVIIGASARPRGSVVSQSPGAGARIGRNESVTLHVSNGHALQTTTQATTTQAATTQATTTTAQAQVAVPSVTGEDLASAAGQIEAAGFVAQTDPTSTSGTAGTVVSQNPSAGSTAPAGSVVELSVATGANRPPVQVPNVIGQKAAAARAALLQAKLTAKTVYKKGPAKDVGVVLAESPTGAQPAYTQVTVTVGS